MSQTAPNQFNGSRPNHGIPKRVVPVAAAGDVAPCTVETLDHRER